MLNALCGRDVFPTGATHGTTRVRGEHPWETATLSAASGFEDARLALRLDSRWGFLDLGVLPRPAQSIGEPSARNLGAHAHPEVGSELDLGVRGEEPLRGQLDQPDPREPREDAVREVVATGA